jgi:hypothetical protein
MRIAYIDDSGSTSGDHIVYGGVIIDADAHWLNLEKRINGLIEQYIPEEARDGFFIHAVELFHERQKSKRKPIDWEIRKALLEEVCKLPKEFNIPIIYGDVEVAELKENYPGLSGRELTKMKLGICAHVCSLAVEWFIKTSPNPSEVAMLVYEHNDASIDITRGMHKWMRTNEAVEAAKRIENVGKWQEIAPFRRVIDAPLFAKKEEATALQLADVCAYMINRRFMGRRDCERYFRHMEDQFIMIPKKGWPPFTDSQKPETVDGASTSGEK